MVQKESPIPSSSDKSHVIRTTAQWNSSGDQYHVIPRGVLCIELTSNGKTKIKVGEGNKCYSQLPYISDMEDLSNYYTKEEVDLIVENLEFMSIKSTDEYESRNQLPKTGNKLGDVRFVKNPNNQHDDPLLYVWNGSKWVFSGGSIIDIDLSEYCKKSEILPRLQQLEALSHTHRNKAILDNTTASFTTEKDEKLASLQNGVLDITQENPEALNELTITFEDETKVLTIPVEEPYELPPATDSTLGGIIVGDGLAIDEDGILSATGGGTGGYYAGHGIEFKNVNPDNVPGEYTVVEYIGNTSASYILTDYVPNTNTKIVADMNVHRGTASWQTIFGARDDVYPGGNEYALFSRVNNDYHFYPRITGNSYNYMTGTYDERITVMIEGNVVTVTKEDQTSYSYTQSGSLSNLANPITIFALHNGNNVGDAGLLELYSFKVYENDTLLKNYVPCYRTSDDVIGLYETIDGVFYTNGGTGNFSKGEDLETLKTINAKIGTGLSFDSNDNIVNEGVLEVSEKQSAPGVFTVSKRDADTDIDLFSSLGKITLNCNMNPD